MDVLEASSLPQEGQRLAGLVVRDDRHVVAAEVLATLQRRSERLTGSIQDGHAAPNHAHHVHIAALEPAKY